MNVCIVAVYLLDLVSNTLVLSIHTDHIWGTFNSDEGRLATRKDQYHYGWDWGPKLMTCGLWYVNRSGFGGIGKLTIVSIQAASISRAFSISHQ